MPNCIEPWFADSDSVGQAGGSFGVDGEQLECPTARRSAAVRARSPAMAPSDPFSDIRGRDIAPRQASDDSFSGQILRRTTTSGSNWSRQLSAQHGRWLRVPKIGCMRASALTNAEPDDVIFDVPDFYRAIGVDRAAMRFRIIEPWRRFIEVGIAEFPASNP